MQKRRSKKNPSAKKAQRRTLKPGEKASAIALSYLLERLYSDVRPENHGRPWSPQDELAVATFVGKGGHDLRPIARQLGRTPFAVFMAATRQRAVNELNCYKLWRATTEPDGGTMSVLALAGGLPEALR
jgi:hypothetical protein